MRYRCAYLRPIVFQIRPPAYSFTYVDQICGQFGLLPFKLLFGREADCGEFVAVRISDVGAIGLGPGAPSLLPPASSARLWKSATAARLGAMKLTVDPLPAVAGLPLMGLVTMSSGVALPQNDAVS